MSIRHSPQSSLYSRDWSKFLTQPSSTRTKKKTGREEVWPDFGLTGLCWDSDIFYCHRSTWPVSVQPVPTLAATWPVTHCSPRCLTRSALSLHRAQNTRRLWRSLGLEVVNRWMQLFQFKCYATKNVGLCKSQSRNIDDELRKLIVGIVKHRRVGTCQRLPSWRRQITTMTLRVIIRLTARGRLVGWPSGRYRLFGSTRTIWFTWLCHRLCLLDLLAAFSDHRVRVLDYGQRSIVWPWVRVASNSSWLWLDNPLANRQLLLQWGHGLRTALFLCGVTQIFWPGLLSGNWSGEWIQRYELGSHFHGLLSTSDVRMAKAGHSVIHWEDDVFDNVVGTVRVGTPRAELDGGFTTDVTVMPWTQPHPW